MLVQEQEMRVKGCTSWGLDTAGLWQWEEQDSGAEPFSSVQFLQFQAFLYNFTVVKNPLLYNFYNSRAFCTILQFSLPVYNMPLICQEMYVASPLQLEQSTNQNSPTINPENLHDDSCGYQPILAVSLTANHCLHHFVHFLLYNFYNSRPFCTILQL